ncbi:hypothetical protein P7C70_g2222, partial [Phenoliferia sp. Uapishka_3]
MVSSTFIALLLSATAQAHMSIWTPSMYGVTGNDYGNPNPPSNPLGPNWELDAWWFRGPVNRALAPMVHGSSAVTQLPAGGSVTLEIACNVAWTSLGCCEFQVALWNQTALDACPGNSGAYHAGDPSEPFIEPSMVAGCALGIADVDDINLVTMDNLAIFSVQHACVQQKDTTFQVPAMMPKCTGAKCICAWFWLANNGTGNFFMTGFDCSVTGSSPNATAIAPPVNPIRCAVGDKTCTVQSGSKRPIYAYNIPTNVGWYGNYDRPGYKDNWSFSDGAQTDIFVKANVTNVNSAYLASLRSLTYNATAPVFAASSFSYKPFLTSSAPPTASASSKPKILLAITNSIASSKPSSIFAGSTPGSIRLAATVSSSTSMSSTSRPVASTPKPACTS